jgi:signal transduction histidine kinase
VTQTARWAQQFAVRPADRQTVMARPARIFLAAELLLGIAYFLLPDSLLRAVVYCTLGLGMVVAVVVGTRLHRPAQPLAWYLLAGGQLSFTVGDAINYTYQWVLEVEPPYPSVADGFYLACYALLAGGLLLLVRERAPGRDLASLIDATIITVGVGLLSWVFLIGPNVRAPDLLLSQRLVSIAYPLCDVLLVAVAVRMWRTGGHTTAASRLLTLGLVALLAADTVYGLSLLGGGWDAGGPVDATWIVFYLGVGLAALHPSMVSLSEPTPPSTRLTRTRLALLAGASLMAPAVLVIQTLRHEPIDVGVIAGGSVVLFLLTLARMGGLASEVAMQAERKRAMQTVLRATEQERVRLAADLHDGPVQELTALRYGLTRARNRIQRGQPEQAEGLLAELEDELGAGITGLRRLMAELRPAVLDEQASRWPCTTRCGPSRRPAGWPAPSRPPWRAGSPPTSRRSCTGSPRSRSTTWASTPAPPGSRSRWPPRTARFGCASTTTASASTRWRPAACSARATSAWPACASGSRWSAATSASTAHPAAGPRSTSQWPTRVPELGAPGGDDGLPDAVDAAVLGEEGEGAGGHDGLGRLLGLVGRQDHHPDLRVVLDDPGRRLEPVRGRHPEVHQHHVGPQRAGQGHPLVPVRGLPDDLDAGVLEHAPQGVADGGGIIDEQHPRAVPGSGGPILFLDHRRLVPT